MACLTAVVSGMAMLCMAFGDRRDDSALLEHGTRIEAQVMRIHASGHTERVSYEFRAPRAPGAAQTARFRGARMPIGPGARLHAESTGRVEIAYDPRDPERNRVVDDGSASEFALLLMLLAGWIGFPLWLIARDLQWRRSTLATGNLGEAPERTIFRVEPDAF